MKILVIHRDNVPSFLRQNTICGNNNEIEIISFAFSLPDTDIPDFDSFVTDSLSNLELWTYDIILLPLNLSENYLEYTGLRVAAHLRLTPKWDCLTTPLLFLGVDKQDEVARFSELGGILFSYQIFYSSKKVLQPFLYYHYMNFHLFYYYKRMHNFSRIHLYLKFYL